MIFDVGDWVRITREGISHDSIGTIVGKELYKGDYIYRVVLLEEPELEITCPGKDIERWVDYLRKKNMPSICECGGDKLGIKHHYTWCPKG